MAEIRITYRLIHACKKWNMPVPGQRRNDNVFEASAFTGSVAFWKATRRYMDRGVVREIRLRTARGQVRRENPVIHLSKAALLDIEEWKWRRKRGLVMQNEEGFIDEVTRIAFCPQTSDRLEILTCLKAPAREWLLQSYTSVSQNDTR